MTLRSYGIPLLAWVLLSGAAWGCAGSIGDPAAHDGGGVAGAGGVGGADGGVTAGAADAGLRADAATLGRDALSEDAGASRSDGASAPLTVVVAAVAQGPSEISLSATVGGALADDATGTWTIKAGAMDAAYLRVPTARQTVLEVATTGRWVVSFEARLGDVRTSADREVIVAGPGYGFSGRVSDDDGPPAPTNLDLIWLRTGKTVAAASLGPSNSAFELKNLVAPASTFKLRVAPR